MIVFSNKTKFESLRENNQEHLTCLLFAAVVFFNSGPKDFILHRRFVNFLPLSNLRVLNSQ